MNARLTMQAHAENYLNERRRLGYRLRSPGHALRSFARYIDGLGLAGPLTVEVMAAWARRAKTPDATPATWARRLKLLRPLARYLQQFDPRTEVPDDTVFGRTNLYLPPHIYREQEVVDLLAAAHRLEPDLRGATYEALFGLLASTGLRVSEAVNLKDVDADLKSGMLTVREAKFAKSRQVVRCIRARPRHWDATGRYATVMSRSPKRRRFSSAAGAGVEEPPWVFARCIGSSSSYGTRWDGLTAVLMPHRAFMICAIMPTPGLCRLAPLESGRWRPGAIWNRHNHRPSRKAKSGSSGR